MIDSRFLFTDLATFLHLDFVSDLKYLDKESKLKLASYIEQNIEPNMFDIVDWNEVCRYMTYGELKIGGSASQQKAILINWLRK